MDSEPLGAKHRPSRIPVIRARLRVRRWPDLSLDGAQTLIAPQLLAGVNGALDEYVQMIKGRTVPGLSTDERLVPPTRRDDWWLINDAILPDIGIFDRVRGGFAMARLTGNPSWCRLKNEWDKLESQWPSSLAEAKDRLGASFSADDLPLPGELWKNFIAWCQFSDADESDTLALLGRFSTFHVPDPDQPPSLDMFAAFDLVPALTELQTQRDAGLISKEEQLARANELWGLK